MHLHEHYESQLNPDQRKAAKKIEEFVMGEDGKNQIFILRGYAGTGKTWLTAGIIRWLAQEKRAYRLLAPTGRAAMVAARISEIDASTIHSHIYDFNNLHAKEAGFKIHYSLATSKDPAHTVYLIDESSMISDTSSGGGFLRFGSGKLLQDLIEFANLKEFPRRRIVFIGDSAQLPPVGMQESPALDAPNLRASYMMRVKSVELRRLVRQKSDSGIAAISLELREAIRLEKSQVFYPDYSYDDLRPLHFLHFDKVYFYPEIKIHEDRIVITHSNKLALAYNQYIRSKIFSDKKKLHKDELLMIVKNNRINDIDLFNGQTAKVLAEKGIFAVHEVSFINREGRGILIRLYFRKIAIEVFDFTGKKQKLECLMLDNLLEDPHGGLSLDMQQALYVDFRNRYPKLTTKDRDFSLILAKDPYFNALQAKYGYAITCHKAQGGEWTKVFVDFTYLAAKPNQTHLRWAYTALTRAQKQLYALNWDYRFF